TAGARWRVCEALRAAVVGRRAGGDLSIEFQISNFKFQMSTAVKQFHEEEAIGKTYDFQIARRLLRYLRPYVRLLIPALILTLLLNLLGNRSEEHTSELQSRENLVCRLLLEKKKKKTKYNIMI